ncbi:MAG: hypothetical protein DRR42_20045 [Gammaproteobacteria bacterium]|nr:MAG: hypothetical protein DRR42_20045 [Gammaproteobacteria bacterium]
MKLAADIKISTPACRFIEDDKLDIVYALHYLVFKPADDPGNLRLWPCSLDRAYDSKRMTTITDRRQANDADRIGWTHRHGSAHS